MIDVPRIAEAVREEMVRLAGESALSRSVGLNDAKEIFNLVSRNFPAPTVEHLEAVIPDAFWASLLKDEGRPLNFRLGLYQPDDDLKQVSFHDFETPVSFTAMEIKRLAPGVTTSEGFLTVQFEGETPVITGIGTHPKYIVKHPFTIHAIPNGELRFTWMGFHIAHFHDGRLDRLSEDPTKYVGVFRGFVAVMGFDEPDDVYAVRLLGNAVEKLREHGHGGSIWMLGKGVELRTVDVKYRTHSRSGARDADSNDIGFRDESYWSESIGQMSGVDGAVVLSSSAEPIGFGAFIEIGVLPEVWSPARGGGWTKKAGREVGGGRHRSAVAFCSLHRPSLAIVVSQDGGMTVVTSDRTGRVRLEPWTPLGPAD